MGQGGGGGGRAGGAATESGRGERRDGGCHAKGAGLLLEGRPRPLSRRRAGGPLVPPAERDGGRRESVREGEARRERERPKNSIYYA